MRLAEPILISCPHGRMLREPKGGPDVVLLGSPDQAEVLLRGANILSVQGRMARVVVLDVASVSLLPADERESLLGQVPLVNVLDKPTPDAGALAKAALEVIG